MSIVLSTVMVPSARRSHWRGRRRLPTTRKAIEPYRILLVWSVAWMIGMHAQARADEVSAQANLDLAIPQIERETGEAVQSDFAPDDDRWPSEFCMNADACMASIGELRIESYKRIVMISPSPRTPEAILIGSCTGLLHTFEPSLSRADARRIVERAAADVMDGEPRHAENDAIRFEMKLTLENLPACSLTRFIQR